jgi:hypothetical protein
MRNTKIYMHWWCAEREKYESETNNKTQKAWETLIIHTYFKSRCRAPVYRSETKKKPSVSLSPPFHHVKAIWRTDGRERN